MCNRRKISNTAIVDAFELFEAQQTIESMRLTRFSDIGELAARIAHDMRNPLSVIKATLEVLHTKNYPTLEPYNDQFQRINRAVMRVEERSLTTFASSSWDTKVP